MSEVSLSYYAVVPVWVLNDQRISDGAKLFYGEISALTDETGLCRASTERIAELFARSPRTVKRWLDELEEIGAVTAEVVAAPGGLPGNKLRRIRLADAPKISPDKNVSTDNFDRSGPDKNVQPPIKRKENINNNPPEPPKRGPRVPEPAKWNPKRFEAFWKFYRENVNGANRAAARKEWDKLKPDDATIAEIAAALVRRLRTDNEWRRGIALPHASTYLNGQMWLDAGATAAAPTQRSDPDPPEREEAFGVWH